MGKNNKTKTETAPETEVETAPAGPNIELPEFYNDGAMTYKLGQKDGKFGYYSKCGEHSVIEANSRNELAELLSARLARN